MRGDRAEHPRSIDGDVARRLAVGLMEQAEYILPGVFYVMPIGMYQVFVDPDLSVAG